MKKRLIVYILGAILAVSGVPAISAAASETDTVPENIQDLTGEDGMDSSGETVDSDALVHDTDGDSQLLQDQQGGALTDVNQDSGTDGADGSRDGITDGTTDEGQDSVDDGPEEPVEPVYRDEFVTTEAGIVYYDSDGNIVKGKRTIGNATYFFDENGIMQKGWHTIGQDTCYFNENGHMLTGAQKIGGYSYYFNPSTGAMHKGFLRNGGKIWYYDNSGHMLTGAQKIDGYQYLFQNDGSAYTGWRTKGGRKYYYDSTGRMSVGSKKIGKSLYYFKKNGAMHKGGFYTSGRKRYYADKKGRLATGSKKIGKYWYYFDKKNGAMSKGLVKRGKNTYYYDRKGHRIKGAKKIKGKWYYFEKNGKRTTSKTRIRAIKILEKRGWNLAAAFNYSAGLPYRWTSATAAPGTDWFADYGFKNGCGDCYVMAGTFCYLARTMGYKAWQIDGYVPSRSGGSTPHSWVEVVINGGTYVFDPDFSHETGRSGYMIWYRKPGTWVYTNYRRMK